MHRIKHLGFNAIKESFDRLPTGVCFFDRTGSIVLCNRRMYQLSRFLLDSDMQHLGEVQEALAAPARGHCANTGYRQHLSVSGQDRVEI